MCFHCLCLVFPLPLPCVSTAFAMCFHCLCLVVSLPLPCVLTAFCGTVLPLPSVLSIAVTEMVPLPCVFSTAFVWYSTAFALCFVSLPSWLRWCLSLWSYQVHRRLAPRIQPSYLACRLVHQYVRALPPLPPLLLLLLPPLPPLPPFLPPLPPFLPPQPPPAVSSRNTDPPPTQPRRPQLQLAGAEHASEADQGLPAR